jgi:hypothetical protein
MSCDPDSGTAAGQQRLTAALTMKPLLLAKEEPDCADHVSESKSNLYDDGHSSSIKSSHHHYHQQQPQQQQQQQQHRDNPDLGSDNEASDHPLSHHLAASGIKLEAALMELNVGLNLISKPNNHNLNDDNNNTNPNFNNATTSNNDNNNNNTSNNNKDGNKAPRKLFECDVCNVRRKIIFFTISLLFYFNR